MGEALQNDYVYDESSRYYYNSSLGYYYDINSGLHCSAASGKCVKNKELFEDENDFHVWSVMWRKARQTKDGEYKDDDVRNVANEIVTIHQQLPWFL
ncbi:hypothetical protein OROGR_005458 [Orobanche gracilis]